MEMSSNRKYVTIAILWVNDILKITAITGKLKLVKKKINLIYRSFSHWEKDQLNYLQIDAWVVIAMEVEIQIKDLLLNQFSRLANISLQTENNTLEAEITSIFSLTIKFIVEVVMKDTITMLMLSLLNNKR